MCKKLTERCHLLSNQPVPSSVYSFQVWCIRFNPCIFVFFTPALPDGIGTSSEIPLQICLKKNYFELVYLLLTKGADPQNVSVAHGDTPLHAAVSICLDNKGKALVCLGSGNTESSSRRALFIFTTTVGNIPISYLSIQLPLLLLFR